MTIRPRIFKVVAMAFFQLLVAVAAPMTRADEIDDAVKMFTADDGLTAAEKLPALKALIEAHKDNPNVAKLTAILKTLAAEAGDKEADAWAQKVASAGIAGVPSVGVADVPPANAATGVPPVPPAAKVPSGPPPIKLYTAADADEAQRRAGRPPLRPRRKRTLSLALPVAEDGFFDDLTSRSAIINVRETIRDLVGPLEGEEEEIFNRKWDAAIEAIRNKSSGRSVGMDSDFGLVEPKDLKDLKIMRNGKRVSAYVWMKEAQTTWNAKYKNVTGQRADLSWENITTHGHPEAYRNKGILEIDTKNDPDALSKMNDLLDHMSLSDAQQISDVTLFKADDMLNHTDFPRLVYVREAARGTAKDMGSKFLPALDSKIKPLEKLELSLTKQGRALSKAQQHELNRLRAAREHYGSIYDTLDKIGRGEMDPSKWDDAINSLAGGQGIRQMIVDMGDLFKFLAL